MGGLHLTERACRLCALDPSFHDGPVPFDNSTKAYVGDQVIALAGPDSREVLVAPATHVGSLTGLAPGTMAELLATVRRVALAVGQEEDIALKTVDLLGAPGHVCVRVPVSQPAATELLDTSSWVASQLREVLNVGR